jgi:hypothetical protein
VAVLDIFSANPWLVAVAEVALVPLVGIVCISFNVCRRKIRVAGFDFELKRDMLQRGMSAEDSRSNSARSSVVSFRSVTSVAIKHLRQMRCEPYADLADAPLNSSRQMEKCSRNRRLSGRGPPGIQPRKPLPRASAAGTSPAAPRTFHPAMM